MPPKLRSKIIFESQDSGFDAIEAAHEGLVPAIVEQLEKNLASFLQEEHASDSPNRQEAVIGNVDVPIHFPNAIDEFQVLIEELKNHILMTTQCLEERMAIQTKAMANKVKEMVEKLKPWLIKPRA